MLQSRMILFSWKIVASIVYLNIFIFISFIWRSDYLSFLDYKILLPFSDYLFISNYQNAYEYHHENDELAYLNLKRR